MDIPPPEPVKLLAYWMEWEKGETPPGRVMSNLKTAGMKELLEQLVAALPRVGVTDRGGPQLIPRPPSTGEGGPPPWGSIPEHDRVITVDDLRREFTARVGVPSFVEATGESRPSAVLAPFYDLNGELYTVLTRRSWDLRSHTGEVSFPGGGQDEGETLVEAALREAHEEIGLDSSTVEVLGELDHLMTISSRSFIVPFVAVLADVPVLQPSPHEVDAILHVPVHELLLDEVYREERWTFGDWTDRSIFFFELVGDTVWGATAAMLRHLLGAALGLGTAIDHR